MSTKLTYKSPIKLTGKVIEDICNRVESTKPIPTTDVNGALIISEKENQGTEIKLNLVAKEVQVCVNGESRTITVYCKPD